MPQQPRYTRRALLGRALAGAAVLGLSGLDAAPALAALDREERRLAIVHTHIDERVDVVYWKNGKYQPRALAALYHFLRDFRTGEVYPLDPRLFDILHGLCRRSGSRQPFQLISGYRSPRTNEMLRRRSNGVAKKSLHTLGKAMDIRLPDVETRHLRDLAVSLRAGGVGYYRKSDFIHVDTGRVRCW